MQTFDNKDGKVILAAMVRAVQENKAYLSDVDGLIGDGDHGVNMNKGFSLFEERFLQDDCTFSGGLSDLGMLLMDEIGGSMGPIYGTVFLEMSDALEGCGQIGLSELAKALGAGLEGLCGIVDARVGDKTLVDTLSPAVDVLAQAEEQGGDFAGALTEMKAAAKRGMESTKELVAKFGRSSRLGERSRGVLDAGAASCCIILCAMADGILALLSREG